MQLAAAGISTAACLLVVTAAPATIVVSFELFGHRHLAEVMARSLGALGGRG